MTHPPRDAERPGTAVRQALRGPYGDEDRPRPSGRADGNGL